MKIYKVQSANEMNHYLVQGQIEASLNPYR